MKKILTILAIALVAGASQAAVIYSNDFSSGVTFTNSLYGNRIGDTAVEANYSLWYAAGDTNGVITNGVLQIVGVSNSVSSTTPRAGIIVLPAGAGVCTLSWDYILWNGVHTDVQVWKAQAGNGTSNFYVVKYTDSGVTSNQVDLTGTATKVFLAGYSYTNTTGATVTNVNNSITFDFDGTGDIVLMFGAAPTGDYYQTFTKFDNVSLDVVTTNTWQDNFSSGITYTNSVYGARIGDETTETSYNKWYDATTAGITNNGKLRVPGRVADANSHTTPRSGVIVLSNGLFTAGVEYELSWNYVLWGGAHTDVQVWNVEHGTSTSNYYLVKYTDSGVTSNQVIITNSATKQFLAGYSYNATSGSVTNSASTRFIYDGTGDIALMFGAAANAAWYTINTDFDDMKLYPVDTNPPPAWTTPIVLAAATQNAAYVAANLTEFVTDADPLTFTNLSGGWLTVDANGTLGGTPGPSDGGRTNEFTVQAFDGISGSSTVLQIWVANVNDRPVWGANPFDKGYVAVGQSLSDTLADRAFDYDGDSLTYAKTTGPSWLTVATNGALSGTPLVGNKGVNSFTATVSDGLLSTSVTFSVVVISGTLVYDQNFNTGVPLYGGWQNGSDGSGGRMTVDLEATPTAWAATWSTNSSTLNLFDGYELTDVSVGISGALEMTQDGDGDSEGVGVAIASNVFGGAAGWYEATVVHAANNAYGTDSKLGLEVWQAQQGVSATNDYYLNIFATDTWNTDPTGQLKIDKPAGSDASFAELASADLGTTLGSRNLTFYYDGNGDVCLLFACAGTAGQGRSAIDNVRVFKVAAAVDSYTAWLNLFPGGTLRQYGLDVNNSGAIETDELPVFNAGAMTYVHKKRVYPSDLVYTLRTTTNLVTGTWSNLYSTVTGQGTPLPGDTSVLVTNSVTRTNSLFLKLDVTE